MNRRLFILAALGFWQCICAPASQAQAPLEKLRLTDSAIGGSQASFWVPYEAGIFRKYGLDVELLYVAGGGRAAQLVQSGEGPIGVFTGGAVINSKLVISIGSFTLGRSRQPLLSGAAYRRSKLRTP